MALGHVLGGGSSINAMVWTRGMEPTTTPGNATARRDGAFKDVLPMFKAQEDWEGGANHWRGVGARSTSASQVIRIPRRQLSSRLRGRWVFPLSTM